MSAILTQAIVSHFFEIQDNTNLYLLIEHVDDLRAAKGVSPASWPLPPLPLLPQLHHATWCDDLSLIQLFTVFDILKEALRRLLVLEEQIRAHRDLHLFVNGEVSDATQMRDNGDGQTAAVKRPRSKCALCDATRSDSGGESALVSRLPGIGTLRAQAWCALLQQGVPEEPSSTEFPLSEDRTIVSGNACGGSPV